MDGILKLPGALRRDLLILIALKLALLSLLHALFFSTSHRPPLDVEQHIAGAAPGPQGT